MTQAQSPSTKSLPILIGVLGALVGAAFFYGITMEIAVALILGAPIGMLVGFIAYRAVPRMLNRTPDHTAQLNGATPTPTIEEQTKPAFRMKIKN